MLHVDELKGTKPTESIDLSNKRLGVASALIIASCIKENNVLKELKCAAISQRSPLCQRPLTCTLPAPVHAVSARTGSGQKAELLSQRASRATQRSPR